MNELLVVSGSCRRCGGEIDVSSNFCSHCGLPTAAEAYPNVPAELLEPRSAPVPVRTAAPVVASPVVSVLNNRLAVIAILLCAGPLGLPALWFSRRFCGRTKLIVTAVYLLLTVVVPLAVAWYFLDVAVRPLVDVLAN